jgi:hypothetical protein
MGRLLKYRLLSILSADSSNLPINPVYKLILRPISYTKDIAIQQNAAVTRANLILDVPFILTSMTTNKAILQSTARAYLSYNRAESGFANLSSAQDAEKRVADAVAADIKLQISIFFDGQMSKGDQDCPIAVP